jgi:hypothetical protein
VNRLERAVSVANALFYQRAYGITLASDEALPGLDITAPGDITTRVHVRCLPDWWADDLLSESTRIYPAEDTPGAALVVRRIASRDAYDFQHADGTRFIVSASADDVWVDWPEPETLDGAAMYLLGPVMTWIVRLKGTTCLHASVIAIRKHAVLLIGGEGAGKSTTAGAMASLGLPILSDDMAPIEDGDTLRVRAGYARLRLWPDSAHALFERHALIQLAPGWDKLGVNLHQDGFYFEPRTLPLGAVYVLAPRTTDSVAPYIEQLSARDARLSLVANSAAGPLLDTRMRAEELALMGRIVRDVPVKRIVPHASHVRLPALCDQVLRDAEQVLR